MPSEINVYNSEGNISDVLKLNDDIEFVGGRVSKGRNCYYKGIGVPYVSHWLDTSSIDWRSKSSTDGEYDALENTSGVWYLGTNVSKRCFRGKTGIFQEKYQPQFSDFIGTCGSKELSILENSEEFELSSVKVLDCVYYDKINHQYYYQLSYDCGRRKYLDEGDPVKLKELLMYMVTEGWNFIWDKNSIDDITHNGKVSDVADIFQSKSLENRLGTVYSVLYSLGKNDKKRYLEFLNVIGLSHINDMDYIYNAIHILEKSGLAVFPLYTNSDRFRNYKNVVLNYLIGGRNCGHCCYVDVGEKIKAEYITRTKAQFGEL